jgi:hypothetical protein
MYQRCGNYARGVCPGESTEPAGIAAEAGRTYKDIYIQKPRLVFVTADVQQYNQPYVVREWIKGGDSGLVEWGQAQSWEALERVANQYKAYRVGVDYGYELRRMEVFEYAARCRAWPMMGRDNLELPVVKRQINPFEGRKATLDHRKNLTVWHFNTDVFGLLLLALMGGVRPQRWLLYKFIEEVYVGQAASMERVAGRWQKRRGHGQNHLWDCEMMQVVMATIYRVLRLEIDTAVPAADGESRT